MKKNIFIVGVAMLIMVTLFSTQVFGQFTDKGIRVGVAGGVLEGQTKSSNDFAGAARIFARHNITDYIDGDLALTLGQIKGTLYQSDLYLGEYKVLYKPFATDIWDPYVGAGLGLTQFHGNLKMRDRTDAKYTDGIVPYLPIVLGTEYTLSDGLFLDANVNFNYAFSSSIASTWQTGTKLGTGSDAWLGVFVGISYTIAGGGPSEAEKEAARLKAEQEAMQAREVAAAEAKRVQDSINAVAEAEAARIKAAQMAEAQRIQDSTNAVAEAKRIQDSSDAAAAARKLAEKRREPVKLGVVSLKTEVGKSVVLEGVVFKPGKAVISPESEQILLSARQAMDENPKMKAEIRGYTDNVGNAKKNLQLSKAQAESVKAWLVKHGIDKTRITAKGYGDKNPIGSNKTPEGRTKNRRIEFFRIK
jgi:outer membrane protein OmpA-like peptidoglycan-associated protein